MTPSLSLSKLTLQAGHRTLVKGASLQVSEGETLGIVGESGSGKTVLLRASLGLSTIEPGVTEGSVSLHLGSQGRANYQGPRTSRGIRRALSTLRPGAVGMVFQDPRGSLNPCFTVSRHLEEVAPGEALQWLEKVHIRDPKEVLNRHPHELSGGMAQRVMVALALASRPALLLADEPTTGLDAHLRIEVVRLIAEALAGTDAPGGEPRSGVVISHDLEVVGRLSRRVVVMLAGRVLETGPSSSLLDPEGALHPYTRWLVERARILKAGSLPSFVPTATSPSPDFIGCPFLPRCPLVASRPSLLEKCRTTFPTTAFHQPDHAVACHAREEGP